MHIQRTSILATGAVLAACSGIGGSPEYEVLSVGSVPEAPAIEPHEARFDRARPVVAVVGQNRHSELTDFVVPFEILAASGAADVVAVSTGPGPIEMFPALTFEADATIEAFDRRYPEGADYVIVPAVHDPEDPALTDWLRAQRRRGATLVGVCDGVLALAEAGVLEGRRATAHWYSLAGLAGEHPGTTWVKNRRYVADRGVITTTGVSASVPVSLALVEAIAGRDEAAALAARLGVDDWSAAHDGERYGVTAGALLTTVGNHVRFWAHDDLGVEVEDGVDAVALALAADLWSRTGRSRVRSIGDSASPVRTRGGLRIVPDVARGVDGAPARAMPLPESGAAAGPVIERVLDDIAAAYGDPTADLVALQIEHPRGAEEGR